MLAFGLLLASGCTYQHRAEIIDVDLPAPEVPDAGCPAVEQVPATWASLYASYFGPQTPGHCGNVGCHDTLAENHGGWACGASAHECYQGMLARTVNGTARPLIDVHDPPASLLIDQVKSPLVWFSSIGNMPNDARHPNACAARDIPRWLTPDGGGQE